MKEERQPAGQTNPLDNQESDASAASKRTLARIGTV